jgi:NAD-dependent dihydropyrimidine dehydrogenase PreA subunit
MIMTLINTDNCIGCAGCGVACPKKCFSFATMEV